MGRAKKKSATKVDAASDVVPQSGKKGKRGSQNVVGKASSAKKQKVERDETLVAKQEVAAEKTPTPTKNGSALDENPKKDSTSDTSEGGESDISDDKPVAAEPTKVSDAADSGENSSEEDNTAAAAPAAVSDEKNESGDDDNEEPKVNEPQQEQEQASSKSSGSDEASGEDENVEDEDVKMADAEKSAEPNSPTSEVSVSKTLFAGNLSFSVAESDLRDFFKDVGEVVDVRLATNFDGRFKGFGHVEFATAEEAQKALELHDHSLLDRPIRLDLARARGDKSSENNSFMKKNLGEDESETPSSEASGTKTIFCGNLSFSLEESDVLEFFKDVGEVVDIRFASDPEGKFKGFGHVEFATAEAAKNALKLHDQPLLDRPIRIDLARERGDNSRDNNSTQHGGKAQTLTAFIKGFNTSLDEDEIRSELEKHFASCGKITRISIPKDYETGLVKGMAYMDFADSGGYNKALRMDNSDMGGGFCLNVEEAKPKNDNGGGRFGGRGGGGRFGGGGGRFGGRGGGRGGRRGGGRGGGRGRGRR